MKYIYGVLTILLLASFIFCIEQIRLLIQFETSQHQTTAQQEIQLEEQNAGVNTQALSLINQFRATKKLAPVQSDVPTCQLAFERIPEVEKDWSHKGFLARFQDGTLPFKRYGEENLARHFYTPESTLTAWIHSPEHLANLVSPRITKACVVEEQGYWAMEASDGVY